MSLPQEYDNINPLFSKTMFWAWNKIAVKVEGRGSFFFSAGIWTHDLAHVRLAPTQAYS